MRLIGTSETEQLYPAVATDTVHHLLRSYLSIDQPRHWYQSNRTEFVGSEQCALLLQIVVTTVVPLASSVLITGSACCTASTSVLTCRLLLYPDMMYGYYPEQLPATKEAAEKRRGVRIEYGGMMK